MLTRGEIETITCGALRALGFDEIAVAYTDATRAAPIARVLRSAGQSQLIPLLESLFQTPVRELQQPATADALPSLQRSERAKCVLSPVDPFRHQPVPALVLKP